ncbi:MAG TPA: hypothetical protein VN429_04045 [Methanospirillum sp.]|uniref:hypothetical protein n=1 Tax=Methanospirillum sp. TaxID=45200 RepID=UPI002C5C5DA9|nr:hypothetical protein [Methanospirillum sp.]HWQ63565.1 hypothetical protein [Methanospirillum sp.]
MVDRTLLICASLVIIAALLFAGTGLLLMYKGTSGHNPADSFPKNDEKMKASDQGNNGDQMHRSNGQPGSGESGSSSTENVGVEHGSRMACQCQMKMMKPDGAGPHSDEDQDYKVSENDPGYLRSNQGCPGMMKQGQADHEMGSRDDTCPCMRGSGMEPGQNDRFTGPHNGGHQEKMSENSPESGRKMCNQCPGQEKMTQGPSGDQAFPGEKHSQGFDRKDKSSSHQRFQSLNQQPGRSDQTNQEQVYLVVVKQG